MASKILNTGFPQRRTVVLVLLLVVATVAATIFLFLIRPTQRVASKNESRPASVTQALQRHDEAEDVRALTTHPPAWYNKVTAPPGTQYSDDWNHPVTAEMSFATPDELLSSRRSQLTGLRSWAKQWESSQRSTTFLTQNDLRKLVVESDLSASELAMLDKLLLAAKDEEAALVMCQTGIDRLDAEAASAKDCIGVVAASASFSARKSTNCGARKTSIE